MSGRFQHYQTNGVSDSAPGHFINEVFQCWWDCYAPAMHCNDLICGRDLSYHLQEKHGIYGSDSARVLCQWNSCNSMKLKKESLARHIEEKHMRIVHKCECGSTYSRRDSLNKHKRTCPYRPH
ncbi:hypothetical protein C8R48DRAFT_269828 [Suillus tomentosus]|nr:hypothetical protein C8R48DRAFT_269828 [Suillus tomentosus]